MASSKKQVVSVQKGSRRIEDDVAMLVGVTQELAGTVKRLEKVTLDLVGTVHGLVKKVDHLDKKVDHLDKKVDGIDKKVDEKTELLAQMMQEGFDEVHAHLDHHDELLADLITRVEALESKVFGINHRLDVEAHDRQTQRKTLISRIEKLESAVFVSKK